MNKITAALMVFIISTLTAILLIACGGGGGSSSGGGSGSDNGGNDYSSVTRTAGFTSNETCPYGGIQVDSGIDENGNGVLDDSEVDNTQYVCNGSNGTDGADGSDGQNALVSITEEPAGVNCSNGGQRIDTGLDVDNDSILDEGEITKSVYVCDGLTTSVTGFAYLLDESDHSGITVTASGNSTYETTTAADGSYTLNGIGQGDYDITFSTPSGRQFVNMTVPGTRLYGGFSEDFPDVTLQKGSLVYSGSTSSNEFIYTSDGNLLVFTVYSDGLYKMDTSTKEVTQLYAGSLTLRAVSSDASQVVFHDETDLMSIPMAGGTAVTLIEDLSAGSSCGITPDSSTVICKDDQNVLHSVPVTGGTVTELAKLASGYLYEITPDSSNVVFTNSSGLFKVSLSDATETLLESDIELIFDITPDGTKAVYPDSTYSWIREVNLADGAIANIAGVHVETNGGYYLKVTPDGNNIIYKDGYPPQSYSIMSISDGSTMALCSDCTPISDASPDSSTFVFLEGSGMNNVGPDLYVVSLSDASVTLLDSYPEECGMPYTLSGAAAFTSDSSYLVYGLTYNCENDEVLKVLDLSDGSIVQISKGQDVYYSNFAINPTTNAVSSRNSMGITVNESSGSKQIYTLFEYTIP